jgi:DNA-binding CsgD family transcriptional regulator
MSRVDDGEALGSGWTLVDSFERDGRRYVLAVESPPAIPGFRLLTVREREIVRQALLGRSNKVIAYELGLAESTVRVLMARATAKVGARSRKDLLSRASGGR